MDVDQQPPHVPLVEEGLQEPVEEVGSNAGNEPILTSLHLTGVDELSTNQIREYIEQHIRPDYSFEQRKRFAYLNFKLNWINDSEINVVFDYNEKEDTGPGRRAGRTGPNSDDAADLLDIIRKPAGDEDGTAARDDLPANDTDPAAPQGVQHDAIKGALDAVTLLTDVNSIRREHVEFADLSIEDQFAALGQAPKLQNRKCWDLVLDKKGTVIKTKAAKEAYCAFKKTALAQGTGDEGQETDVALAGDEDVPDDDFSSEEYRIIQLEVRYSTLLDRKVHNAREYSRYYLIHGEPDKNERLPSAKEHYEASNAWISRYEPDLITGTNPETYGSVDYAGHREEREIADRYPDYQEENYGDGGQWSSDRYHASESRRRGDRRRQDYRDGDRYRLNARAGRKGDRERFREDRHDYRGRDYRRGGSNSGYGGVQKRRKDSNRVRAEQLPDLFPDFGKKH